jgi:hypothetical protein
MYFEKIVGLCCARSAVNESAPSHTKISLFDNDESFKVRCLLAAGQIMKNTKKACDSAFQKYPTRLLGALTHWPHRKYEEPHPPPPPTPEHIIYLLPQWTPNFLR